MVGVPRRTWLAAILLAAGCAPARSTATGAISPERVGLSLFDRPWTWADEEGRRVTFAQWRGSPIVVTTIYTTCTRTCPLTVDKLRTVYRSFQRRGRDAQFLLVTLDPSVDTTERLREYKQSRNLPGQWHLLRGDPRDTRELADLLDIHVMDMEPHIVHDARIAIFDERGAIARSFECCDFDDDAAVR
jgi:cytochrome oxidase Cu insertion factor (SCO1/SenC/PrrC family)